MFIQVGANRWTTYSNSNFGIRGVSVLPWFFLTVPFFPSAQGRDLSRSSRRHRGEKEEVGKLRGLEVKRILWHCVPFCLTRLRRGIYYLLFIKVCPHGPLGPPVHTVHRKDNAECWVLSAECWIGSCGASRHVGLTAASQPTENGKRKTENDEVSHGAHGGTEGKKRRLGS